MATQAGLILTLTAAVFVLPAVPERAVASPLEVIVRDEGGDLLPARVRVRDAGGKDHVPPETLVVPVATTDKWFVCDGRAALRVPAGAVEVRAEHGLEYSPGITSIDVTRGEPARVEITLKRWIDMRQRGYTCGENHLHVPLEHMAAHLVAEGMDFGTSLQWWNGPKFRVPDNGFVRTLEYAGRKVSASAYDVELEYAWGAAYLIGVPQPLKARPIPQRPNLPVVRQTHEQGTLVCYQGGYSPEVMLDALLGCVDVVNVCNNNFHRHRFQPRSRYSNLLNVPGFEIYADTPEGMMRMNTHTYYRLLNCGLRIAAGAGSATGAKPTPVGYNRAYVRMDDPDDLPAFLAAWKAGRNFVTNGPMLFMRVDDTHQPGDDIKLDGPGHVLRVRAEAIADDSITSLEIVVNGEVVPAEMQVRDGKTAVTAEIPVRESCWITARCTGRDEFLSDEQLARYDDGKHAQPCRLRFAHTSPVYVTVAGKPVRVEASVDEARRMLDAMKGFVNAHAADKYKATTLSSIEEARRHLDEPRP